MNRWFRMVMAVLFAGLATAAFAQPTISFVPRAANGSMGQQVTVDVIANGMPSIEGMAFTIAWNNADLTYVSVQDFNIAGLSAGNFNQPSSDKLVVVWNNNAPSAVPIPNGTILFSVTYTLASANGQYAPISFSDNPTPREVIDADFNDFAGDIDWNNGYATQAGPGPGGGGGGGNTLPCDGTSGLWQVATWRPNDTVTTNQKICADIYACGFTDLISMQYTLEWNPARLRYDSVTVWPTALNLDVNTNFGTTIVNTGRFSFSWGETNGVGITLPANTRMYSVCFTAIGGGNTADTLRFGDAPTMIEAANSNTDLVPVSTNAAPMHITGSMASSLNIAISSAEVEETKDTCLAVTVQNFENLRSLNYTSGWDPALVQFKEIKNLNPAVPNFTISNFNLTGAPTGSYSLAWSHTSNVTLPNNAKLYDVCYTAIGSAGAVANLGIAGATATNNNGALSVAPVGGSITIKQGQSNTGPRLEIDKVTATVGQTNVCADVKVYGFNNIVSITIANTNNNTGISFNPSVAQYASSTDLLNAIRMSGTITVNAAAGQITYLWTDDIVTGVTLPDGANILRFCFNAVGPAGSSTDITFPAGFVEIANTNGDVINFGLVNGKFTIQAGAAPTVTGTTTTACGGGNTGSIALTVTGGTAPYSYNWSNGATTKDLNNIAAGNYSVTVTATGGATATASFTVMGSPAINISGLITHQSAPATNNGAIDINVTGGTPPFTYLWTGGSTTQDISSLAPGNYTVTVTDSKQCTNTATYTVNAFNSVLSVGGAITNVNCFGYTDGSINVNVTGGITPYTYLWSHGPTTEDVNNLAAGNYSLTVTDNTGRTATQTFTVGSPSQLNTSHNVQAQPTCVGSANGAVTLNISGGTPGYTLDWNEDQFDGQTAPSDMPAGNYEIIVSDSKGCSIMYTFSLSVPATGQNPVTGNTITNANCGSAVGAVTITTNGQAGLQFSWSTGAQTQNISGLVPGTYGLTVTTSTGCTFTSSYNVQPPTTPVQITLDNKTHVVCADKPTGAINILAMNGRLPYTYKWTNTANNQELATTQNLFGVFAGTYQLLLTDADGCTYTFTETVTGNPPLVLTPDITNATVNNNDGKVELAITGGVPNYTVNGWGGPKGYFAGNTTVITDLTPGYYRVSVTDNAGCTKVLDSITVRGVILIESVNITNVNCNGGTDGSISLNVRDNGLGPYEYKWSSGQNTEDISNLAAGSYTVTILDRVGITTTMSFTVTAPPALNIALVTLTDESGLPCTGSIDVTVTGGTPPYTYQWNNGETGEDLIDVCKGKYRLVVTDKNGCVIQSQEFTVNASPFVLVDATVNDADCNGGNGSLEIELLGGVAPYTFTIPGVGSKVNPTAPKTTFTNIPPGSYVLTATDKDGKTFMFPFVITAPTSIAITNVALQYSATQGPQGCSGIIDITPAGGTPTYRYQWSNGATSQDITNVCPGNYTVTITDANNCTVERQFDLTTVVSYRVTEITCADLCNGNIALTVNGNLGPYQYLWSDGGTTRTRDDLCEGIYSVTISDKNNNTLTVNVFTIDGPDKPLVLTNTLIARPFESNANGTVQATVSGGWGNYTYQWSNGSTSSRVSGLSGGTITVTVTDDGGCELTETINLNPVLVTVNSNVTGCNGGEKGTATASLNDNSSNYVFNWSTGASGAAVSNLAPGNYQLTVTNSQGLRAIKTVTIGNITALAATVTNFNDNAIVNVTGGTAPYAYVWQPGNIQGDTYANIPAGTYRVLITDANDCTLEISYSKDGENKECSEVRDVITPDADGLNDEFVILCAGEFLENTLRIFDRWGQLVYEKKNYQNTWKGTHGNGDLLQEGGYFYVFEYTNFTGEQKRIKGSITIVR